MNGLIFLIIISVLIFVHELGHFLMARRIGIKVEKFSLGFGPKLFSFKFQDVDFKLSLIPFGGYVKLAGDDRSQCKGLAYEYFSKTPLERAKVVFFGPLFNYLTAFILLWVVYCIGYPQLSTKVGKVLPNMPAQAAGILEGDKIIEINGKEVKYWSDVLKNIRFQGKDKIIRLKLLRADKNLELSILPISQDDKDSFGKKQKVSLIGIAPSDEIMKERYDFFTAFGKSFLNILEMTWMTLKSILMLILGYLSFKEAVTGPIGIFHITSGAVQYGLSAVLHVTSMLSLALAIFNVLPIPVLDGGHILFLGIEQLRKKPLSEKVEQKISDVGFGFIIILAVFIFLNDLVKFGYLEKAMQYMRILH